MRRVLLLALAILVAGCGKKPSEDYSPPVLDKLLKDSDPGMRCWAAEELGKYGAQSKDYVPDLIQALKDRDKTVRVGAAYGLAGVGPDAKAAVPALKEALKDKDREVRTAAGYALLKIEGRRSGS